jgi:hypothetical protein
MVDQELIDISVAISTLLYNLILTAVFIFRAYDWEIWEKRMGIPFNLLIIPFSLLLVLNILNGWDFARLGMSTVIVIFLFYDLWYRTITKEKPRHHPEKWPTKLIIYFILLQIGSITLNGYGFLISKEIGLFILTTYFLSLFAFTFYQYRFKRQLRENISS